MIAFNIVFAVILQLLISYIGVLYFNKKAELGIRIINRYVIADSYPYLIIISTAASLIIMNFSTDKSSYEKLLISMIMTFMAVLAVTDRYARKIPNTLILAMLFIWLVQVILFMIIDYDYTVKYIPWCIAGFMIAGGVFLFDYFLARGGLGAGDVKMAAVLGLYLLSDRAIAAILCGIVLFVLYRIAGFAIHKASIKSSTPMAPFLFYGSIIAILI